jgi:hypothetical protein
MLTGDQNIESLGSKADLLLAAAPLPSTRRPAVAGLTERCRPPSDVV